MNVEVCVSLASKLVLVIQCGKVMRVTKGTVTKTSIVDSNVNTVIHLKMDGPFHTAEVVIAPNLRWRG